MFRDYYEILGVDPDSSVDEIKKAYRRRARESHPDLHPDHSDIQTGEMRLLIEAQETLTDPRRRKVFDENRSSYYMQRGIVKASPVEKRTAPFWKDSRFLGLVLILLLIVLATVVVGRIRNRMKIIPPTQTNNIGMPHEPGNMRTDRLEMLLQTIENNPADLLVITEASTLLFEQGRYDEALNLAQIGFVTADAGSGDFPRRISRNLTGIRVQLLNVAYQSCVHLEDFESAKYYILQLLELTPENQEALDALERIEREQADPDGH